VLGLQSFEFLVEGVILGVGDLRGVLYVVAAVVIPDQLAQVLDPAPNVQVFDHEAIIRAPERSLKRVPLRNKVTVVYCTFRMTKKRRKELRSVEEFEKELREEISVSVEFDLPLTIVLALNIKGGWKQGALRRALDVLRVADLATRPGPAELLFALPNTTAADARAVEERLREAVPEATSGVATYREGDSVDDLLERARSTAR
jgi:hypothetical protein